MKFQENRGSPSEKSQRTCRRLFKLRATPLQRSIHYLSNIGDTTTMQPNLWGTFVPLLPSTETCSACLDSQHGVITEFQNVEDSTFCIPIHSSWSQGNRVARLEAGSVPQSPVVWWSPWVFLDAAHSPTPGRQSCLLSQGRPSPKPGALYSPATGSPLLPSHLSELSFLSPLLSEIFLLFLLPLD